MSTTRFAQNLARLRKHIGYSQQDMADRLQVARSTYAGWERGISEPPIHILQAIQELEQHI